jgi:C-terminal processing protease CtpA/Prc
MKKLFSVLILILLLSASGKAQEAGLEFNPDFEIIENGLPVNWYGTNTGDTLNYKVSIDSAIVVHGKYAAAIEFTGKSVGTKYVAFALPNNYDGKKITLSGYLRTENITEGYAGLWMAINHRNEFDVISFNDEMQITGSTDWKKHEITLEMNPANTKNIVIYGVLFGNGKMWLDNLKVTIDGKDLQQQKPYENTPFPAEKDKEFDNGSHIAFPELNKQNTYDLALLGRIWGFLKYHHPAIAEGNYNWDYELFRFLPGYLKTGNREQRDQFLLSWIDKLGNISGYENIAFSSDSIFLKPDLTWIDKSDINEELKSKLKQINKNRYQGNHYYVMLTHFKNPLFLNESDYAVMPYPDAGFRLLALYRYWNMVHYFYPSKYLTDKDWNDVLDEYIPYFIETKDELAYELTVIRLIGEICDSHAANLLAGGDKLFVSKGYLFAPLEARFIENKLVITDYYTLKDTVLTNDDLRREIGIKAGDVITHINAKPVDAIIDSIQIYYPASNKATKLKNMAFDLFRLNQKSICLDYITASGERKQKNVNLFSPFYLNLYRQNTNKYYKVPEMDIGYINLETLVDEDILVIEKEFMNYKGIILDLRSRPTISGRMLSSWFVSSQIPFLKRTKGNPNNPGEFVFTLQEDVIPSNTTYTGKVVVLVDEKTLSEGEYQAMMFRAGKHTIIVGSQTAGANGRVSDIFLPGGIKTWFSGVGIYYPNERETQRIGIIPDIEVKPTIDGIREGRDEQLEKAIEIILQE